MTDLFAATSLAVQTMPKEKQDVLYGVRVHSQEGSAGVTLIYVGSLRGAAVAEASLLPADPLGEGTWYLNRVLVQDPECRGRGVGSYVLSILQATLRFRPDCQRLVVEPGGYSSKIQAQRRFYRRAGFVKKPKMDNVYIWNAK